MRFLMLNWRDPKNPLAGGAERVTEGYLAALRERGHEVFWFANAFPGAAPRRKSAASASAVKAARAPPSSPPGAGSAGNPASTW